MLENGAERRSRAQCLPSLQLCPLLSRVVGNVLPKQDQLKGLVWIVPPVSWLLLGLPGTE